MEAIGAARGDPARREAAEAVQPELGREAVLPEAPPPVEPVRLVEKGVFRTENKNLNANFTNEQWDKLLTSTRTEPGPVWGGANKNNEDAKAFAFINSKQYNPVDKNTGVVDTNFTGEVNFEKVNDWAARRRYAQEYIKQPDFTTRKELPELLRFDSLKNKTYDTIEVGKPFKLSGITATSADKRFITGIARSAASLSNKYPKLSLSEKIVVWHYKRDDVFERNVGNVRVNDGGTTGSKKCPYELTVGGNNAIVDKIEEKNGVTHVYAHLEDD